ncbi:hypothetical protein D3C81_1625880 [compost metagenome]
MIAGSPFMVVAFRRWRRREAGSGAPDSIAAGCEGFYHGKGVVDHLRVLITALIVRVNFVFRRAGLLGGEREGDLGVLNHLAHFADAFGALGSALIGRENLTRTSGARLDGLGDVTLAKAVTVADVQGDKPRGSY